MAGEEAVDHFVHPETTFDEGDEVRRHVTVLVLTPTRLIVAHADDHSEGDGHTGGAAHPGAPARAADAGRTYAAASTEAVPLDRVTAVVLTHVVDRPERYRPGGLPREVTLGVAWGIASRVDLEPAGCSDPECDADHGYTGSVTGDDLVPAGERRGRGARRGRGGAALRPRAVGRHLPAPDVSAAAQEDPALPGPRAAADRTGRRPGGSPRCRTTRTGSLAQLLPSVAGAVGAAGFRDTLALGYYPRVCTVLVDGLGARLLAERGGHAPFLRRAAAGQPDGRPGRAADRRSPRPPRRRWPPSAPAAPRARTA